MTPVPIPSVGPAPSRFRAAAGSPDALAILILALVASSLFFFVFPGVDVAVSRAFYDADQGFTLVDSPPLRGLRASSTWIMAAVLLLAFFQLARHAFAGRLAGQGARRWFWLLSGLVAGPGLLVNGLLKEHWGRPRPIATDLFGGEAPFQNVWVVSDWCDGNCSFVSGEASSAAWLVAAALIAPRRFRAAATTMAALYAIALSINRIAFGAHYLSDILLAWLLCALVFAVLSRFLLTTSEGRASRPFRHRPSEEFRP